MQSIRSRRISKRARIVAGMFLALASVAASAQTAAPLSCQIKTQSVTANGFAFYGPTLVAFRVPIVNNRVDTVQTFVNGGQTFRYTLSMNFSTFVPTGTSSLQRLTNGEISSRPLTNVQITNSVGYFFDRHPLVPLALPAGTTNGLFNTFCSIGIGG